MFEDRTGLLVLKTPVSLKIKINCDMGTLINLILIVPKSQFKSLNKPFIGINSMHTIINLILFTN